MLILSTGFLICLPLEGKVAFALQMTDEVQPQSGVFYFSLKFLMERATTAIARREAASSH